MTNAEAIETLRANYPDACFEQLREAVDKAIKALEEQEWIPCKERLSEKEVDVLCCRDNKTMTIMHFNPVLTTRYPKGFSVVKDAFSWRQDNVIAWMPLPEPYKEGEQDD